MDKQSGESKREEAVIGEWTGEPKIEKLTKRHR